MTVRPARPEDAAACCDVLRRSIADLCGADHRGDAAILAQWLGNKTPEALARWIADPGGQVMVYEEADAILAVGSASKDGEIRLNYVAPEARFRGVSKAMVAALEAYLGRQGVARICLTSTATARRFYQACGYRETGGTESFFGAPAYAMEKVLIPASA